MRFPGVPGSKIQHELEHLLLSAHGPKIEFLFERKRGPRCLGVQVPPVIWTCYSSSLTRRKLLAGRKDLGSLHMPCFTRQVCVSLLNDSHICYHSEEKGRGRTPEEEPKTLAKQSSFPSLVR